MLEAKNLKLVYPDGNKQKVVLDDVNFTINKGEHVILLGPSGSGKSSLIYLLSLLKKPTSGDVIYDNKSLTNVKDLAKIRYDSFGFIFQQHFLISYLTVIENVIIAKKGNDKEIKDKAIDVLNKLGLGEHLNKKPHQLSGGERQRVAIARAIVKNPKVIFADEPTASLDHQTAVEVMQILKNYNKDTIIVMATHDTSLIDGSERIFKVFNGKVEG